MSETLSQRQKRDHKPAGRRLTKGEVKALRAAPDLDTRKGKRDRALLDTMLYAGLRCEEVAHLTMDDLCQDRGRWWFVLAGKGQKTRKVKIADPLYESLAAWLTMTERAPGRGTGPMFVSVNRGDNLGEARPEHSGNQSTSGGVRPPRWTRPRGWAKPPKPSRPAAHSGPHSLRQRRAPSVDSTAVRPCERISTTMAYIGVTEDENGGAVDFVNYDAVGK